MSSLYQDFVAHYTTIAKGLRARREYDNSWLGIKRSDEVSAIRSYLLDKGIGVDYVNTKVSTALSNNQFNVKFASLFCHKKPTVKRTTNSIKIAAGSTPGCELGDLFVFIA